TRTEKATRDVLATKINRRSCRNSLKIVRPSGDHRRICCGYKGRRQNGGCGATDNLSSAMNCKHRHRTSFCLPKGVESCRNSQEFLPAAGRDLSHLFLPSY